nr:HAD-IA family hydrolase [Solimicrobium silvestre]
MQWMRANGRRPQTSDAGRIMSQPGGLADVANLFDLSPPVDLLAAWEAELHAELATVKLFPDSLPTIARLRNAGYRIGLCSNLAAPYGTPVKALLPSLDAYAWSYEAGAVKPEPGIYRYLLDRLGCAASDVLFIGDTPAADLDGPLTFGMSARLIDRKAGQTLDKVLDDM